MRNDITWGRKAVATLAGLLTLGAGLAVATPAQAADIRCKVDVGRMAGGKTRLQITNTNRTGNPYQKVHSFRLYWGRVNQYSKTIIPTEYRYTVETATYGKVEGWQSGTKCVTWYQGGAH